MSHCGYRSLSRWLFLDFVVGDGNSYPGMLKTLPGGLKKRLDKFSIPQLAHEAEGIATDVLVGVLQVESHAVAVMNVSVCHWGHVPAA